MGTCTLAREKMPLTKHRASFCAEEGWFVQVPRCYAHCPPPKKKKHATFLASTISVLLEQLAES